MDFLINKKSNDTEVFLAMPLYTGKVAKEKLNASELSVIGVVGNENRLGYIKYVGDEYADFHFIPVGDLNNYDVFSIE